mgnify:CR=1 FL=1
MRMIVLGLLATGLAGCASTSADAPSEVGLVQPGAAICNAQPVQSYIGQRADQALGAAILKASGARSLRWGPPNSVWTMDFREDRVNVQYDERLIITQITCG